MSVQYTVTVSDPVSAAAIAVVNDPKMGLFNPKPTRPEQVLEQIIAMNSRFIVGRYNTDPAAIQAQINTLNTQLAAAQAAVGI